MSLLSMGGGNADDYKIDQSLRVTGGKLVRTPTSAGNRRTWTYSAWVKRSTLDSGSTTQGDSQTIFSAGPSSSQYFYLAFSSSVYSAGYDDTLYLDEYSFGQQIQKNTSQKFKDIGGWYHIVVAVDTTQATASNRIKVYVNGEQVTDWARDTNPPLNYESQVNSTNFHGLGESPYGSGAGYWQYHGYLAEVNFIDGTALDSSYFGETNSDTNQWVPIKYAASYGTNGFYLPFSSEELANSFTDSTKYTVESFTSTGSTSWTAPSGVTSVEYLVVAGGGAGGGGYYGGGGGAGGMLTGTHSVTPGTSYTVTVGAGGAATSSSNTNGSNGSDSVFDSITANGGGGGGAYQQTTPTGGGSGGGGGRGGNGAAGTSGQGNAGGNGNGGASSGGGGGGGAGAVGGAGAGSGGSGGVGLPSTITGTSTYYAGGGGGGSYNQNNFNNGGQGGGGTGNFDNPAGSGTANTGGGGGGASVGGNPSGAGGSGIVIVKYLSAAGTVSRHTITANGDVANSRAQAKIGDSSIKFDGTGDYLTVPSSDDWDFGTGEFTLEMWIRFANKNTSGSGANALLANHNSPNGWQWIYDGASNLFDFWSTDQDQYNSSSITLNNDTWYHVAVTRDGNTLRHYIDGVQYGSNAFTETMSDTSTTLQIGSYDASGLGLIDGYMDEIRISDTCRYPDGTTFTPSTTAFTADANTKLLIHSDFNGGLGADNSGNQNDYSLTNITIDDQVLDSPTNNFSTINAIANDYTSSWTLSEGNLKFSATGDSLKRSSFMLPSSGKWYCEVMIDNNVIPYMGVASLDPLLGSYNIVRGTFFYNNSGLNSSYVGYDGGNLIGYSNASNGDIVGIAHDSTTGETKYYLNNSLLRTVTTAYPSDDFTFYFAHGSSGGSSGMTVNFGQDSSFAGAKTAQGNQDVNDKGDFYYAPPTNYLALCEDNLPDPSIADPTAHFETVLYTGDGNTTKSVNIGMNPDLSWVKRRDSTGHHHSLVDTVRGDNALNSDQDIAEYAVSAFDFNTDNTIDVPYYANNYSMNTSSATYVAWNWKAGGTASSNTDGDITSSVSANTTSGFSIVKYTGSGVAGDTMGHGLSQAPEMVIMKKRISNGADGVRGWHVWHKDLTDGNYLALHATNAQFGARDFGEVGNGTYPYTEPTASLITFGGVNTGQYQEVNYNGDDYIMYCFHSVEGYSKVGTYTGNGSTDGPFTYTGFRPAWIMLKNATTGGGGYNWVINDSKRVGYNPDNPRLRANLTGIEDDTGRLDIFSNGFKMTQTYTEANQSGATFVYLAFAESPFKTANAR